MSVEGLSLVVEKKVDIEQQNAAREMLENIKNAKGIKKNVSSTDQNNVGKQTDEGDNQASTTTETIEKQDSAKAAEPSPKQKEPDNTTRPSVSKSFDDLLSEKTKGQFPSLDAMTSEMSKLKEGYDKMKKYNDDLLKDDFIRQAVEYYNVNGTLKPYLEAMTANYDQMSDDDVIRKDMRNSNPEYSDKVFDRMFQKEMEKYQTEEEMDPSDIDLLNEEKHIRAERIRKQLKESQHKFTEPFKEIEQRKEEADRIRKEFISKLNETDDVKELFSSKKLSLSFKSGNDEFKNDIPVSNPEDIYKMMIEPQSFFDKFADKEKGVNYRKVFKNYLHAIMGDEYENMIFNMGRESLEKEIKNVKIGDHNEPNEPKSGNSLVDKSNDMLKRIRQNNNYKI